MSDHIHVIIIVVVVIEGNIVVVIESVNFLVLLCRLLLLEVNFFFFFILGINKGSFAVIVTLAVIQFGVSTTEIAIVLNLLFFVVIVVLIERSQNIKDLVFIQGTVLIVETILVERLIVVQVNDVLLLLRDITILVFLAVITFTGFILIFSDRLSIQGDSKLVLIILVGSKESGIVSLLVLVLTVLSICNIAHLLSRNISLFSSVNGVCLFIMKVD